MKICYIDEAGCTGVLPSSTSEIQPVLIVCGLFIDTKHLHKMTNDIISIKKKFYPGALAASSHDLDWMNYELKGSDIRKKACENSRRKRRHSKSVIEESLKLCEDIDAHICGRIWVKGISTPINGTSIYTASIQNIFDGFQNYLEKFDDFGFVIADSRLKHQNNTVSHSIFTQKFKNSGDKYNRVLEAPTFAHSDNHAGLQLSDFICSALLTPIAVNTYCEGFVSNIHVRPLYSEIKKDFSNRCKNLQHRYLNSDGRYSGGLTVSDPLGKKSGSHMFRFFS